VKRGKRKEVGVVEDVGGKKVGGSGHGAGAEKSALSLGVGNAGGKTAGGDGKRSRGLGEKQGGKGKTTGGLTEMASAIKELRGGGAMGWGEDSDGVGKMCGVKGGEIRGGGGAIGRSKDKSLVSTHVDAQRGTTDGKFGEVPGKVGVGEAGLGVVNVRGGGGKAALTIITRVIGTTSEGAEFEVGIEAGEENVED
jgi:hypothetical protein